MSLAATPAAATASGATFKPLPASQGTSRSREAMNNTPERTRKNFNAYDRPIEWYRLPFAIKLAVLNLWRAEQADPPPIESDTVADEYSAGPGTETHSEAPKPSDADRRAPEFGGLMKVVVVMPCLNPAVVSAAGFFCSRIRNEGPSVGVVWSLDHS